MWLTKLYTVFNMLTCGLCSAPVRNAIESLKDSVLYNILAYVNKAKTTPFGVWKYGTTLNIAQCIVF